MENKQLPAGNGKVKMTFGIQKHHIERINKERARWNQPDKDIPGTPSDAILIEGFWEQLGQEFGWHPFTLALHYMKAERRIDNNTGYRSLWDYLHSNHDLKLLESEVGDLVHFVHKFHPKQHPGAVWVKGDYDRLYDQLKANPEKRIVCYVDYDGFSRRDGSTPCRDICTVKGNRMEFTARGIGYGGAESWLNEEDQKEAFLKDCVRLNVEWLDESASPAAGREDNAIDYQQLKAQAEKMQKALRVCKKALENSYDVLSYPATGKTMQDKAIAIATEALNAKEASNG